MRSINFRDGVLHAVAYKLGLDPEQSNFLTNQAIPIGTYIDEWVRRVYSSRDWPEWTTTHIFAPTNHIVPWDTVRTLSGAGAVRIGRVLKVFLIDPSTTDAPVDTEFTETDTGIHVGFDHGSDVWVRYLQPAPRFTAVQWRPEETYKVDDVVYSYTTGECYKSKANNNIGNDPAIQDRRDMTTSVTQVSVPDDPGFSAQNKILKINLSVIGGDITIPEPPPNNSQFYIPILDDTGALIDSVVHVANGTESQADILTDLYNQLTASVPLAAFTFTLDTGNLFITAEAAQDFQIDRFDGQNHAYYIPENGPSYILLVQQLQSYIPLTTTTPGSPQILELTIPTDVFPGSTYSLDFTDSQGEAHSVEYVAMVGDGTSQIAAGLVAAVEAAVGTDDFFGGVLSSVNVATSTVTFSTHDIVGLYAVVIPAGSTFWELVPFPRAIADQVIRGAYADLLKEWGQADKGMSEEQQVPTEIATSEVNYDTTPNPALTGQQRALSRYKL